MMAGPETYVKGILPITLSYRRWACCAVQVRKFMALFRGLRAAQEPERDHHHRYRARGAQSLNRALCQAAHSVVTSAIIGVELYSQV
jgi:hypothetical protein